MPDDARMTNKQALALLAHAERGKVRAATFGFGSDGYPPANADVYVILTDGRAIYIGLDGAERQA